MKKSARHGFFPCSSDRRGSVRTCFGARPGNFARKGRDEHTLQRRTCPDPREKPSRDRGRGSMHAFPEHARRRTATPPPASLVPRAPRAREFGVPSADTRPDQKNGARTNFSSFFRGEERPLEHRAPRRRSSDAPPHEKGVSPSSRTEGTRCIRRPSTKHTPGGGGVRVRADAPLSRRGPSPTRPEAILAKYDEISNFEFRQPKNSSELWVTLARRRKRKTPPGEACRSQNAISGAVHRSASPPARVDSSFGRRPPSVLLGSLPRSKFQNPRSGAFATGRPPPNHGKNSVRYRHAPPTDGSTLGRPSDARERPSPDAALLPKTSFRPPPPRENCLLSSRARDTHSPNTGTETA